VKAAGCRLHVLLETTTAAAAAAAQLLDNAVNLNFKLEIQLEVQAQKFAQLGSFWENCRVRPSSWPRRRRALASGRRAAGLLPFDRWHF
jgi:hypothetical protein